MTVSMSAVWDRTAEFLSAHLAAIGTIAAVTMVVPAAISGALAPLRPGAGPGLLLGLALLSLLVGLLQLWGSLTITALALEPEATTATARSRATRRLPAMIVVAIALLLILVVLMLPIVIALLGSGVDLTQMGQGSAPPNIPPGVGAFVLFYSILVALPVGLWLTARLFVLAGPVVVAEQQTLGALRRAFALSRGLAWKIIGVALLYGILMFVATLAAVSVFGAIFNLVLGGPGVITAATVATAIVSALVASAFNVIGAAFPAKLYLAARDRESAAAR